MVIDFQKSGRYTEHGGRGYEENIIRAMSRANYYLTNFSDTEIRRKTAEIEPVAVSLLNNHRIDRVLAGALLYEKLGRGKEAAKKLQQSLEKVERKEGEVYRKAQKFIERNPVRESSIRGLETRVAVFLGSTIAGIALSIYSLTATGNAIGNLTGTSQGLLGLILFVVGIAGLVFSKK